MATITKELIQSIIDTINASPKKDYLAIRSIVNPKLNVNDDIPIEYIGVMFKIRHAMYNPADTAIKGKETEVRDRLTLFRDCGKKTVKWLEFSAHDKRRKDIIDHENGISWDVKTTVSGGDFLYSKTSDNFDHVVNCYRRRKEYINYKNDEYGIDIFCPWDVFFDYLIAYNPEKGLSTWFRTNGKKVGETCETVFQMQVVRTSKKKVAYLQAFDW